MAGGALAGAVPAYAHHSYAMFDRSQVLSVSGTVKEFNWTNPHSSFAIVAPSNGSDQVWYFEMGGPETLARQGWKRSTVAPGDKVTVSYNPLRNGGAGGSYVGIVLPNGTRLGGGDQ